MRGYVRHARELWVLDSESTHEVPEWKHPLLGQRSLLAFSIRRVSHSSGDHENSHYWKHGAMLSRPRGSTQVMRVWLPEWLADREGVLDKQVAAVLAPVGR